MKHFIDDPLAVVNSDLDFSNLGIKPIHHDEYRGFPVRFVKRSTGYLLLNSRCFNGLGYRLSSCALDRCKFPTITCVDCSYEF